MVRVTSIFFFHRGIRRLSSTGPSIHVVDDAVPASDNASVILPNEPVKTARRVITSSGILRDTMNDLYGENGTAGIAKWDRFSLLNDYLRSFRLGEVTLLTGPTGSGKTTFLSEYSLDLAISGVKTLWCNFELKNSRLCAMMVRQLYSTFNNPLDPAQVERSKMAAMVAGLSDRLPLLFGSFHGATKVDRVVQTIKDQDDIDGIHHVVLDNLQYMIGVSTSGMGNPFSVQDSVFSNFRKLATERNIHVTIVMHPRKFAQSDIDQELSVHSLYGGGKASQEADNILLIQTRRDDNDNFSKYLQIAKNRYFGDTYMGDRMLLSFHKASQRHRLIWKKAELRSLPPKRVDEYKGRP